MNIIIRGFLHIEHLYQKSTISHRLDLLPERDRFCSVLAKEAWKVGVDVGIYDADQEVPVWKKLVREVQMWVKRAGYWFRSTDLRLSSRRNGYIYHPHLRRG